jgi:glycosyltransferase involved in cell wall biosynthesis
VIYAYAGYPACLWALSAVRRRDVLRADITPRVSFVITARNESKRIREKLENTLAQDYPADRFEIIVASDCSTDDTDAIVRSYMDRGVRLVRSPERRGKEFAQKLAVEAAEGEILVFSDVATRLDPDGVHQVVKSFHDPSVGCVSSVDRMIDSTGQPTGEGGYVRYEMKLRGLETAINSVVGLSGSFFAARREICRPWQTDVPSDFTIVFNAISRGQRGVSDPYTIGYYRDLADPSREYSRKVRTIVRGVSGLLKHRGLLNPFRYGLFAWQLASHKLCRWLVPFALVGAALANLVLLREPGFYWFTAVCQVVFYTLAALSLRWPVGVLQLGRPAGYLLLANLSILDAWFRLLRGQTVVQWTPSER